MNADLRSNTLFGVAIAADFPLASLHRPSLIARAEAIVDPIAESGDFLGARTLDPLSKPQPRRTNTSVIQG
jgi:hypothetical protein